MQFADKQAASSITLSDGTVLTACDQCQTMYAERNPPEEPPCETCRVIPMLENAEAFKVYYLTRYQLIISMGGVIDVNQLAIDAAIARENVRDPKCFNKVYKICREYWVPKLNETKDDKGGKK